MPGKITKALGPPSQFGFTDKSGAKFGAGDRVQIYRDWLRTPDWGPNVYIVAADGSLQHEITGEIIAPKVNRYRLRRLGPGEKPLIDATEAAREQRVAETVLRSRGVGKEAARQRATAQAASVWQIDSAFPTTKGTAMPTKVSKTLTHEPERHNFINEVEFLKARRAWDKDQIALRESEARAEKVRKRQMKAQRVAQREQNAWSIKQLRRIAKGRGPAAVEAIKALGEIPAVVD